MADLDPQLARLKRYIEGLPQGFDSYPDHLHKGAVVRQFLDEQPLSGEAHRLPEPLAKLVNAPPLTTAWVPEVHATAMFMAACDLRFPSDEAFVEHARAMNRSLLGSPFFRALFQLVPVSSMLRGAAWRWEHFHRGIKLQLVSIAPGRAEVRLEYPTGLVPRLMATCYATALEAALEACGARGVRFPMAEQDEQHALFQGTWS